MNKKFLTMAGVVAVLGAGTFWGLEIFDPHKVDEAKFPASVSADQVFAGKLDPNGPSEAPATAGNGASTSSTVAAAVASTTVAAAAVGDAAVAATTPAAAATAAAPAQSSEMMTPATTGESAAASTTASADTSTTSATAPVASSEPAAAESAPAASPSEPAAANEPAPAEAAAPTAAETPAAPPAPAVKHKSKAKAAHRHAVAGNMHWWPAENPAQLSLVYAGPASFKKAVVLMFNGAFFKTDGLDANLKVTDKHGKPVSGSWELGENNRRMLVFPVPANGTYKVSIDSGLTDSQGRKIAHHLGGPVIVR
ncbi:MAG: hypothetical protein ACRESS_12020 [Stenotrophobium sp.]